MPLQTSGEAVVEPVGLAPQAFKKKPLELSPRWGFAESFVKVTEPVSPAENQGAGNLATSVASTHLAILQGGSTGPALV